jgi:asparagine N-glycosylation enzyme membrane subunit Stt3
MSAVFSAFRRRNQRDHYCRKACFHSFLLPPFFFTGFLLFLRPGSEKKKKKKKKRVLIAVVFIVFIIPAIFTASVLDEDEKHTECNREKLVFMLE